jgi:hypothetical protein
MPDTLARMVFGRLVFGRPVVGQRHTTSSGATVMRGR